MRIKWSHWSMMTMMFIHLIDAAPEEKNKAPLNIGLMPAGGSGGGGRNTVPEFQAVGTATNNGIVVITYAPNPEYSAGPTTANSMPVVSNSRQSNLFDTSRADSVSTNSVSNLFSASTTSTQPSSTQRSTQRSSVTQSSTQRSSSLTGTSSESNSEPTITDSTSVSDLTSVIYSTSITTSTTDVTTTIETTTTTTTTTTFETTLAITTTETQSQYHSSLHSSNDHPETAFQTGEPLYIRLRQNLEQEQEQIQNKKLIHIGFNYSLNYHFVASNRLSQSQIFSYLPAGFAHSLLIDETEVIVSSLWPFKQRNFGGELQTIADVHIPANLYSTLRRQLHDRESILYTNQTDASVGHLMKLIDPNVPLQGRLDALDAGHDGVVLGSYDLYGNLIPGWRTGSPSLAVILSVVLGTVGFACLIGITVFFLEGQKPGPVTELPTFDIERD